MESSQCLPKYTAKLNMKGNLPSIVTNFLPGRAGRGPPVQRPFEIYDTRLSRFITKGLK